MDRTIRHGAAAMAALFQSPVPWYDGGVCGGVAASVAHLLRKSAKRGRGAPARYTVIVRRAFGVAGAAMVDRGDPNNRCAAAAGGDRGDGMLAHE